MRKPLESYGFNNEVVNMYYGTAVITATAAGAVTESSNSVFVVLHRRMFCRAHKWRTDAQHSAGKMPENGPRLITAVIPEC